MLVARPDAILATASAATLAGIGIFSAQASAALETDGVVDRELLLQISDGFTRQTWRHRSQVWTETRDTLALHEEEVVRLSIFNDTTVVRVIALGDDRTLLRIKPGEAGSIDVLVDRLAPIEISVIGQPAISRPVKVRASYGAHANVA